MDGSRSSGILLPVASLPSPYGIGDFGPEAYRFVDWLVAAGQSWWMILPLGIPDELGSPFDSPSAFALNWMLVSPDLLVEKGFLTPHDARRARTPRTRVEYGRANVLKRHVLGLAWMRFQQCGRTAERRRFASFKHTQRSWLADYSCWMAIKDRHSGAPWYQWPKTLKNRHARSSGLWEKKYRREIDYFAFGQWVAHEQWTALKSYANRHGIGIIGNMPHFVTYDSVDVWARPQLFSTGKGGVLRRVAGAPPDRFNAKGQLWGNPLYDWPAHRRQQFRWWREKTAVALARYDRVVLDHFRGFVGVWEIPARDRDAHRGEWTSVPGNVLFSALARDHQQLPFIAEDLGNITDDVHRLRERCAIPGMRILQFGAVETGRPFHWPPFPRRSVAMTGTHDNHTAQGWLTVVPAAQRAHALAKVGGTQARFSSSLLAAGMASESSLFVVPMQDILSLGDSARLNTPSTTKGNWQWRCPANGLRADVAKRLWTLTAATGRIKKIRPFERRTKRE